METVLTRTRGCTDVTPVAAFIVLAERTPVTLAASCAEFIMLAERTPLTLTA